MIPFADLRINGINITAWMLMIAGGIAAVAGAVLTIRKRIGCTELVEAEVLEHQTMYHSGTFRRVGSHGIHVTSPGGQRPGAVYTYSYGGMTYRTYPVINANGCDPIGTKRTLKINPKNPEKYLFTDRQNEVGGILMSVAGIVAIVVGAAKL